MSQQLELPLWEKPQPCPKSPHGVHAMGMRQDMIVCVFCDATPDET